MQVVVADVTRVSTATVCRVLPKVCMVLLEFLPTFVKMPESNEERQAAASAFHAIAGFPRTIGAIDCTHIKIQSPGGRMVSDSFFSFFYFVLCG